MNNEEDLLDPVLWNDWHVVADTAALHEGGMMQARLLGVTMHIARAGDGGVSITGPAGAPVHCDVRHGFVWACLGAPANPIIDIPELDIEGMTAVIGGAIAVHVSAGRAIENFLDLGHLGYVHAGYLGAEPLTAVTSYRVDPLPSGGLHATGCEVFQPNALMDNQGLMVGYSYKVERPFTAWFDKVHLESQKSFVSMYLFAQPVDEEHCVAHTLLLVLDNTHSPAEIRGYQQLIFLQDKPILENQHPKRLPIGPGMERPVLADKMSIAYRRWIAKLGVTYGVIRVAEELAV